jgi:hypothetical protein
MCRRICAKPGWKRVWPVRTSSSESRGVKLGVQSAARQGPAEPTCHEETGER